MIQPTQRTGSLPDADRVSVFTAVILLAYTLTRFIALPAGEYSLQLPGIFIVLPLNLRSGLLLLIGGLAAAGADWLVRDHPALQGKSAFQHSLSPALTAMVIGLPLADVRDSALWWTGLLGGGVLITLTLVAEYIIVDPEDARYPLAASGLTAISFAIFFLLAVSLRGETWRLYGLLPIIFGGALLVILRALHLRLQAEWPLVEAGLCAFMVTQIAAALHYWPLSPLGFGLAVLGPAYALTSLIGELAQEKPMQQALVEPLVALGICWAGVWVVG